MERLGHAWKAQQDRTDTNSSSWKAVQTPGKISLLWRSKRELVSVSVTLQQGWCAQKSFQLFQLKDSWMANLPPCDGMQNCLFETAGWIHGPQREVMTKHKQFTHQHHPPDSTTTASWLPPLWIILLPGPSFYPSQGINSPGSNFTM